MFSPFREGFIFEKLRIREVSQNKNLAKISEFTVKRLIENVQDSHFPTFYSFTNYFNWIEMCGFV